MNRQIHPLAQRKSFLLGLLIAVSNFCSYAREAIDVGRVLDDTVQMLEQVDPAMAAQMKNITPEQQKELEQQLNVVFEKMGTMSPEELKHLEQHPEEMFDFVEKTVAEQAAPTPPVSLPTQSYTFPEEKPKVTPTPTPVKPTQETLKTADLLEKIISITEEFMLKATTANLESKINRWAEKNKIKNWQTGLRYKKFKEQLLSLVKSLRTIQEERDPETKQLVYIDALTKNSALLNSLQRLNTTLTNQWYLVELPEQDLDSLVTKLSRETKTALKTMLGAYAQALLNMPMQLDALMKSYDPRTKELREKEAQLSEKALKERKLPYARPMGDLRSRESGYGRGGTTPYDYSGYGPYSGDYGSYNQPYGSYPGGSSEGDSGKTGGDKGGSGKGGAEKSKKDADEEKDKKLKASTPPARKDRALELTKENLKELETYLINAENALKAPADIRTNTADIETATEKIARVQETLTLLKHEMRYLDKKEEKKYGEKIAGIWKPRRGTFDTASSEIGDPLRTKEQSAAEAKKGAPSTKTSQEKATPTQTAAINAPGMTPLEQKQVTAYARAAEESASEIPLTTPTVPQTAEFSVQTEGLESTTQTASAEVQPPVKQPETKGITPEGEERATSRMVKRVRLDELKKGLDNLIQNFDKFMEKKQEPTPRQSGPQKGPGIR